MARQIIQLSDRAAFLESLRQPFGNEAMLQSCKELVCRDHEMVAVKIW